MALGRRKRERQGELWGLIDVGKRCLMYAAGHNLGVIMRKLFGLGTPRSLQAAGEAGAAYVLPQFRLLGRFMRAEQRLVAHSDEVPSFSIAEVLRRPFAAAASPPARAA